LQQVALFALPRFVQDQDYPGGSRYPGGIPDLDAMSQGYRWVRDDCGRGWNIVSGKLATFTAIGYFLNLYRIIKEHQGYEPSLLRTLQRHSKSEQVAFSSDSRLLASGSQRATIDIWELAIGAVLCTLSGHSSNVLSIAFSPNNKLLASGSRDTTIKIWEVATAQILHTLAVHSTNIWSIAFSPDNKQLASGSRDTTIKLWRLNTGVMQYTLEGHSDSVYDIAFSPDGKQLASASGDGTIKLWNL